MATPHCFTILYSIYLAAKPSTVGGKVVGDKVGLLLGYGDHTPYDQAHRTTTLIEELGRQTQQAYPPMDESQGVVKPRIAIDEVHRKDGHTGLGNESHHGKRPHTIVHGTMTQVEVAHCACRKKSQRTTPTQML